MLDLASGDQQILKPAAYDLTYRLHLRMILNWSLAHHSSDISFGFIRVRPPKSGAWMWVGMWEVVCKIR
jgi:hypothetical protein